MTNFQTKGEVAQWRMVYDVVKDLEVGAHVTYATLGRALGMDPVKQRNQIRSVLRNARKHLLRDQNKAMEAVRGTGYRVVAPNEHLRLAQGEQRKASKALVRGTETVVHVDMNALTEGEKAIILTVRNAFAIQQEHMKRHDIRQARLERVIEGVSQKQNASAEQLEKLQQRLDELEKKLEDGDA